MIDANTFRRVRRKVMRRVAVSFEETKSNYVRTTANQQIHCIKFEAAKYGHEFTLDLGLHFEFLPTFAAFSVRPVVEHPEPETCVLMKRVRKPDNNQFFGYGDSVDEAEQTVEAIASECLATFQVLDDQWKNGLPLLDVITASSLEGDAAIFWELWNAKTLEDQNRLSDSMLIRKLFPGWYPRVLSMAICLAHVAAHHGRLDLVEEYLAVTSLQSQRVAITPAARSMIQRLRKRLRT
jgi:hypothetical protein